MSDTLSKLGDMLAKGWLLVPIGLVATTGVVRFVIERLTFGRAGPPSYNENDIAEVYRGLRRDALARKPADGRELGDDTVYGVVIDWGRPRGVATITAYGWGDSSLYFSRGGGILGGIGHRTVREAASRVVDEAQKRLRWMQPADDGFPLPRIGRAKFYVLTNRGILCEDVRTDPIEANVAGFWTAAQPLLTAVHTARPDDPA